MKPETSKSRPFVFLLVVVLLYVVALLVCPERAASAFAFGLKMLTKLAPVLVLVFFLMFVANYFIKPSWIKNHVGHDSGIKGVLVSITAGIISMGPIYVWYGMLHDFRKKGMRPAFTAMFLYSRSIKLPLLPLMVHYFGIIYTVVLLCYMTLFAALNGFFTEWLAPEKKARMRAND